MIFLRTAATVTSDKPVLWTMNLEPSDLKRSSKLELTFRTGLLTHWVSSPGYLPVLGWVPYE